MGVEILGSVANIGKIIEEKKVTDVIFSTDALSYADILSVISRSRDRSVNFRLVPSSIEVIIGKTHIDQLDDIPLLDIDYNIDRLSNRITKRIFDVVVSVFLLFTLGPLLLLKGIFVRTGKEKSYRLLHSLSRVLKGEMSLVGPMRESTVSSQNSRTASKSLYLGRPGLTGLAQLSPQPEITNGEIEKYNLYYAKNQSLWLDAEILSKFLLQSLKGGKGGSYAKSRA